MTKISTLDARLWFPSLGKRSQGRLRLFCFPYAGGGASLFSSWSEQLPADIEVCPVQLPGRESRLSEQAFSELDVLLDALVQVLLPYLDKPYAFFGHSMGALISFELTRALRRNASVHLPRRLIVSGRRAPQLPGSRRATRQMAEEDFIAELRQLKGTPEIVLQDQELLQLLLPLLRADFALCESYLYQSEPPLPCPLTAMGGLQDAEVAREHVTAWSTQTTLATAFKLRFFPGDHFFLHQERAALLRVLAQDLFNELR